RLFPALPAALADGRLTLTSVLLVSPWLTHGNAGELVAEASHKTKREVETLLARHFPRSELPAWVEELGSGPAAPDAELVPERVGTDSRLKTQPAEASPASVFLENRSRVKAVSAQSYGLQLSMTRGAHDKLRYVQGLLGHEIPSGDLAAVVERALDMAIGVLEKRKFAATTRPRRGARRPSEGSRHVPAHVRREVWLRDGGQCAFVSESGHRCQATVGLEFDRVLEVARGGEATVHGICLLCRADNQYEAERTFGTEFMRCKRDEARERAVGRRARTTAVTDPAPDRDGDPEREVKPWLKALGVRGDDLRRGVAAAATIPDASLEERVRFAVSTFARGGRRHAEPGITPPA
ncbi:MAG: HNH endonuclease, partial [Candidatus Eiseniibacteriota bacterium]